MSRELPPTKRYLVMYNAVEAALWSTVLIKLVIVGRSQSWEAAHDEISDLLLWVQTSAVMEIIHVAIGIVPSPLFTTIMQVASRLLLVWGIDQKFPQITSTSPAFVSMVVAWSITEILRYSYYAINLQSQVPDFIMWMRYTFFYFLYPIGAGSECWLMHKSLDAAEKQVSPMYKYALIGTLIIYVPGFYFLYTYMITQRRRMFKRQGKKAAK